MSFRTSGITSTVLTAAILWRCSVQWCQRTARLYPSERFKDSKTVFNADSRVNHFALLQIGSIIKSKQFFMLIIFEVFMDFHSPFKQANAHQVGKLKDRQDVVHAKIFHPQLSNCWKQFPQGQTQTALKNYRNLHLRMCDFCENRDTKALCSLAKWHKKYIFIYTLIYYLTT